MLCNPSLEDVGECSSVQKKVAHGFGGGLFAEGREIKSFVIDFSVDYSKAVRLSTTLSLAAGTFARVCCSPVGKEFSRE